MHRSHSKTAFAALLSSTALWSAVAYALLPACSKVVSVGADPVSLEFTGSDFDGSGPATRTTTVCYTGPGQADCTATLPAPFSLVSGDGATTEQFIISEGSCHDLVVALAEPADLDERLTITVSGEQINGSVAVALLASAQGGSGDAGSSDGGGGDGGSTDGGSTDGGSTDGGGSDGGGEDGGGTDGGSSDGGGDTGDTGTGVTSPCPVYSGLATTQVRTYETADTYTDLSGLSGTKTVTIDATDPAAPVLETSFSLTDSSGRSIASTERQTYSCNSTGSTLILSLTAGSIVASDGSTTPIARIDTYSDGMLTMVPGFGTGENVSDNFTFDRDEDGRITTVNGSNVVNATGSSTVDTSAGSFSTTHAHIMYSSAVETQNYNAYLDEELGVVTSFYWELVSVE